MPVRDSYRQGTPSWIDLGSPDPDKSKAFYSGLFGWTYDEQPMGDDPSQGVYSMAQVDGRSAAAVSPQPPMMAGAPPFWNHYITVDDIDATVGKIPAAGGSVMMEPFDIMDAGRMAVVGDPTGAMTSLWQAKEHIGAEVVNEDGTFIWSEVITPDPKAAVAFYCDVLGLQTEEVDMGPMGTYHLFTLDGSEDSAIGGAMAPPPGPQAPPPHWAVYFAVDDADATVAKAIELGGSNPVPAMDGPPGRMAMLMDDLGAPFWVMKPSQPVS